MGSGSLKIGLVGVLGPRVSDGIRSTLNMGFSCGALDVGPMRGVQNAGLVRRVLSVGL